MGLNEDVDRLHEGLAHEREVQEAYEQGLEEGRRAVRPAFSEGYGLGLSDGLSGARQDEAAAWEGSEASGA